MNCLRFTWSLQPAIMYVMTLQKRRRFKPALPTNIFQKPYDFIHGTRENCTLFSNTKLTKKH